MLKDFKAFILRGNVVDLAVGVVIGAAFAAVVTALVEGIFTPLLAIPGETNFGDLKFTIGGGDFMYGNVTAHPGETDSLFQWLARNPL